MPAYLPILLVVLTVLLVGAFMIASGVAAKRRARDMAQAATDFGWTFSEKDHDQLGSVRKRMRLFTRGRRKAVSNVLAGRLEDLDVFVFDYAYTTGGGKNQHRHRQTVAAIRRDGPAPTSFELRPEGFFFKITEMFGAHDIDFEGHPVFSDRYALSGPDEDAVRELFGPDVIAYFERVAKGIVVESDVGWLIVYRARRRVAPDELSRLLDEAVSVATVLDSSHAG